MAPPEAAAGAAAAAWTAAAATNTTLSSAMPPSLTSTAAVPFNGEFGIVSHGKAAMPSAASCKTCCAVPIHEAIAAAASPGGTLTSNEWSSSKDSPSSSMPVILPGSATSWHSMS